MQNTLLDFLSSALIPELSPDIAAGAAGYVQLILVGIAAVGAGPDELAVLVFLDLNLSVIAAYLAVVALEMCIRDSSNSVCQCHSIQLQSKTDRSS